MGQRKYYQLVAGSAHIAFAGGVDWLDIPDNAVTVGDFCKAVFEADYASFPAGLASSALVVFTLAENTSLQQEASITSLGESEDDPLFVLIPEVWFQLVDGRTHAAFAGTSVQSLPLAEDSSVDMLRGAVFLKVSRALPNHVRTRRDLRVYDDVEAYKANRPVKEDEMSTTLNQRGRAPDNPLCVVVPPPSNLQDVQLVVGGASFWVTETMEINPLELVSFWKALASVNADIEQGHGTVIELPGWEKVLERDGFGSKIFIRQCYPELLKICMTTVNDATKNLPHLVVLGTPGIGKTFFGLVLLLHLAQNGATVVYENARVGDRVLFTPELVVRGSPRDFVGILRRPTTYYIADGVQSYHYSCKTILLTGPQRAAWYDFGKSACEFLYMPVWSKEEILACHAFMYADTVPVKRVEECYLRWGGVVRYVLELALSDDNLLALENAIAEVDLDLLVNACGKLDTEDSQGNCHYFLHYSVNKQFGKEYVVFASLYVQGEIYKHLHEQNKDKLLAFLAASDGLGDVAVLRGHLFEQFVHQALAQGGRFTTRRLVDNANMTREDGDVDMDSDTSSEAATTTLELRERQVIVFKEDAQLSAANTFSYLRPLAKNYQSVDAIVKPDILFQVTSASVHPCKQDGLEHVLKILDNPETPRLYFVLPPDRFEAFSYQQYVDSADHVVKDAKLQKIQQFALKVEL